MGGCTYPKTMTFLFSEIKPVMCYYLELEPTTHRIPFGWRGTHLGVEIGALALSHELEKRFSSGQTTWREIIMEIGGWL